MSMRFISILALLLAAYVEPCRSQCHEAMGPPEPDLTPRSATSGRFQQVIENTTRPFCGLADSVSHISAHERTALPAAERGGDGPPH